MNKSPIPSPIEEDGNQKGKPIDFYARVSWLCPIIAWASQIILTLLWRGISGLGLWWLLAMWVQIGLIVAGLYFGGRVLLWGRSSASSAQWWSAIVGIILSGGTVLLVIGLIAAS